MKLVNVQLTHFDHPLCLNLHLDPKQIYLLLGDSGCGKTSFLKAIAGFTDLRSGEISNDGEHTAMLLQNPFHQIIMQKVRDELTFPLRNSGMGKDEADDQCMEIVEKLQIGHLMDRDISTLSFGETQLVMIAATCLTPADILLMDEPTSHLDPPFVKRFYQCMRDLANEGKSVCITSQSPDEYIFADEIWIMEKGVVNTQIDVHKGSVALKDAGILLDKDMVDKKLEEYGK